MLFVKGDGYSLKTYTDTVKATMLEEGCDAGCVDSMTSFDAESVEGVATDCGCPSYMVRYNNAQTLNLATNTTTNTTAGAEAPKEEEPKEGASKTPYFIGGGVGLIALIGGIVYYKKTKDAEQSEGGNFEKML